MGREKLPSLLSQFTTDLSFTISITFIFQTKPEKDPRGKVDIGPEETGMGTEYSGRGVLPKY